MVTVIFLDDNNEAVSISFSHHEEFNKGYVYGVWNIDTNEVQLNDNGWAFFHEHRKDIRRLKPMMDKLDKRHSQIERVAELNDGIRLNYYVVDDCL